MTTKPTCSERAKQLLAKEEGFDVDFKQSVAGLDSADLVAFANSDKGGTILIGVQEVDNGSGKMVGTVIGCNVSSGVKLAITDKGQSCIPAINVDVVEEVLNGKFFLRLEISSGDHKPYCTKGGTYKTRGDAQNQAMQPGYLLNLFLEKQANEFVERFRKATIDLENSVHDLKEQFLDDVYKIRQELDVDFHAIHGVASEASNNAEEANVNADETLAQVGELLNEVQSLDYDLSRVDWKLKGILEHLGIEDAFIVTQRKHGLTLLRHITEDFPTKNHKQLAEHIGPALYLPRSEVDTLVKEFQKEQAKVKPTHSRKK